MNTEPFAPSLKLKVHAKVSDFYHNPTKRVNLSEKLQNTVSRHGETQTFAQEDVRQQGQRVRVKDGGRVRLDLEPTGPAPQG